MPAEVSLSGMNKGAISRAYRAGGAGALPQAEAIRRAHHGCHWWLEVSREQAPEGDRESLF